MRRVFAYFGLICCGLILATNTWAMPGMGTDRFGAADQNRDEKLSKEEFAKAFPQINAEAFPMIDLNHDDYIDRSEWDTFRGGHDVKADKNMSALEAPK